MLIFRESGKGYIFSPKFEIISKSKVKNKVNWLERI